MSPELQLHLLEFYILGLIKEKHLEEKVRNEIDEHKISYTSEKIRLEGYDITVFNQYMKTYNAEDFILLDDSTPTDLFFDILTVYGIQCGGYDNCEFASITMRLVSDEYNTWIQITISDYENYCEYAPYQLKDDKTDVIGNYMYYDGIPLDAIREMLGHSELSTTLGYIYNPLTEGETYSLIKNSLDNY